MKELHSDCSLYERCLRDFLSTYVLEIVRANVYLYDVSHNKQQQEAIRWYNNWPPSPLLYIVYRFRFTLRPQALPLAPFCLRRNLNRINQTNFDKMSFTMKSKSLYLPLFLSVCLSISQSLSLFLSLLPIPPPPRPLGPVGLVWPGPIRPFLLLCCAPPTLPPLPHSNRMPPCHGGVHSIFTIYYYCYYYNNYKTKHNCIGPWILGILGEGDHSTHCSRPADIHQIEVFLLLLHTYYSIDSYHCCFTYRFFNTLVFFWPKNIPAPARGLLLTSLSKFSVYPESEASEAGRIGINGH